MSILYRDMAPIVARARRVAAATGRRACLTFEGSDVRASDDAAGVELQCPWTLSDLVCLPLWAWDAASSALRALEGEDGLEKTRAQVTLLKDSICIERGRDLAIDLTWGGGYIAIDAAAYRMVLPAGGPTFSVSTSALRKALGAQSHEHRGIQFVQLAVLGTSLHVGASRLGSQLEDAHESSRWMDAKLLRAGLDALAAKGSITISLPGSTYSPLRIDAAGGTFALAARAAGPALSPSGPP